MKKYSRFLRISLKAFLILFISVAGVCAWLANHHVDYRREQAAIDEIRMAAQSAKISFTQHDPAVGSAPFIVT